MHKFNNAIEKYKDYYIIAYRFINSDYHPWSIWWEGKKLFEKNAAKLNSLFNHYRTELEQQKTVQPYKLITDQHVDATTIEIHYNNQIYLYENILNGQDCRIKLVKNKIYLMYTAFIANEVCMIYRTLEVNTDSLNLGREKYMFKNLKTVDKNCVFDSHKNILYSINDKFSYFDSQHRFREYPSPFQHILDFYGDIIYFSFGTPTVTIQGYEYGVGHLKFKYKQSFSKMQDFVHSLSWIGIVPHSTYIYCMFFYKYKPDDMQNIQISCGLLLCDSKFYLNFPVGVLYENNKLKISYGEGDIHMKYWETDISYIDSLIGPQPKEYKFLYQTKPALNVYGYYRQLNAGDDAYEEIFKYLFRDRAVKFHNPYGDLPDTKILICGGGDIINDHFMTRVINRYKLHAVSVGLYDKKFLEYFESIYTRTPNDFDVAVKSDLSFVLNDFIRYICPASQKKSKKLRIGISIPQTYKYNKLLNSITKQIISKYNAELYFIPFCTKHNEDDRIFAKNLKYVKLLNPQNKQDYLYKHNLYEILKLINDMDFMICGRFHAHIFSILLNKPFVSLSREPKCKLLMQYEPERCYDYEKLKSDFVEFIGHWIKTPQKKYEFNIPEIKQHLYNCINNNF